MRRRFAVFVAAGTLFACLHLPFPIEAQSSIQPRFTPEQIAGEYVCRWPREAEGRVKQVEKDVEYIRPFGSDEDNWPRDLVLSSDGKWHARNESGDFAIKGFHDDELQIKAAAWVKGQRAKLVADRSGAVAIALYAGSRCGNDKYDHLRAICERKAQPFDEKAAAVESSILHIRPYLPDVLLNTAIGPPGEMDGKFSCGLANEHGRAVLMHAFPPVSYPKQLVFRGRKFWMEQWPQWISGEYEVSGDNVALVFGQWFGTRLNFARSKSVAGETLLEAVRISGFRLQCYRQP